MPRILAAAFAVALALTLAGCGGVSEAGDGGAKLTLAAYSTPREVYCAADEGLRQDRRGAGRRVRRVIRQLGRAEPRRRSRGSPPTSSRSRSRPTSSGSSKPGWWNRPGPTTRTTAWSRARSSSSPSQEQSEGHRDLGRPRQGRDRGDRAESVHLRRRPLERDGRVRRAAEAGQDATSRLSSTSSSSSSTSPSRTRARASRSRPSSAVRATSCSPTRTRRSSRRRRARKSTTSCRSRRS